MNDRRWQCDLPPRRELPGRCDLPGRRDRLELLDECSEADRFTSHQKVGVRLKLNARDFRWKRLQFNAHGFLWKPWKFFPIKRRTRLFMPQRRLGDLRLCLTDRWPLAHRSALWTLRARGG